MSQMQVEADRMDLCQSGEHFRTLPGPAVAGGCKPPDYSKQVFTRADGTEEESAGLYYVLHRGEKLACFCQGGCGIGDPFERDVESVREDVLNEIVSLEKAHELYGVLIDSKTLEVDKAATEKQRAKRKRAKSKS